MDKDSKDFIELVIVGVIGLVSLGGISYLLFKEDEKKVDESREIYEPIRSEKKKEV